jgi:hypothetical protein
VSATRKMILKRFAKVAAFMVAAGGLAALVSPDFRTFVDSDLLATFIVGFGTPLLAAVEKWAQRK